MLLQLITDAIGLAAIAAEPRAVAFLTVPWSGPERVARAAFLAAAERLASPLSPIRMYCCLIDEEAEPCLSWLASLGVPGLGAYPLGAGSVLWLAEGRVVFSVVDGQLLTSNEIVARVGELWQPDA